MIPKVRTVTQYHTKAKSNPAKFQLQKISKEFKITKTKTRKNKIWIKKKLIKLRNTIYDFPSVKHPIRISSKGILPLTTTSITFTPNRQSNHKNPIKSRIPSEWPVSITQSTLKSTNKFHPVKYSTLMSKWKVNFKKCKIILSIIIKRLFKTVHLIKIIQANLNLIDKKRRIARFLKS